MHLDRFLGTTTGNLSQHKLAVPPVQRPASRRIAAAPVGSSPRACLSRHQVSPLSNSCLQSQGQRIASYYPSTYPTREPSLFVSLLDCCVEGKAMSPPSEPGVVRIVGLSCGAAYEYRTTGGLSGGGGSLCSPSLHFGVS